jgi:hypothetical protein
MDGELAEDAVVGVVAAAFGAVVGGVLRGLADVEEREVAAGAAVAGADVEAGGASAAREQRDGGGDAGLAGAERADAGGGGDAVEVAGAAEVAAEVDRAADRGAAVGDRDEAAVDGDAAEAVEREVGEVDDAAAAADRDAVEEDGDLLGGGAAQGEGGELAEAAERAHVDAGGAGQDLGEGVAGACAAIAAEVDGGREAGVVAVEGALLGGRVGVGADDRSRGAGLWGRSAGRWDRRREHGRGRDQARGGNREGRDGEAAHAAAERWRCEDDGEKTPVSPGSSGSASFGARWIGRVGRAAGLLARGSSLIGAFPRTRWFAVASCRSRRLSQWREPRRSCTDFPFTERSRGLSENRGLFRPRVRGSQPRLESSRDTCSQAGFQG